MSLQAFPAPFIYDLFKGMGNYSLSYVYKGNLDPQLTDRILDLAETNMNITGESSKTQKRVFFIMVESLQNITRHQDNKKEAEEATQSFFVMQNTGKEYQISSGNVIESSKVEEVKGK